MVNKNSNGVTGMLLAAFLMVIIGVSLIGIISQTANAAVTKSSAQQFVALPREEIAGQDINTTKNTTLTYVPTGWKVVDCPLTNVKAYNTTYAGTAIDTILAEDTDYVVDESAGIISFLNTSQMVSSTYNNITSVSYSYCSDDYLNSSWGRTVLPLVGGFFALAILGVGLALFFKVGKVTGLI